MLRGCAGSTQDKAPAKGKGREQDEAACPGRGAKLTKEKPQKTPSLNDPGSKAKTKSPKTKLMGAVDWDAEGAAPWRHGPREKHAL